MGNAIAREKQTKGWVRSKKVALIKAANPIWEDISKEWFEGTDLRHEFTPGKSRDHETA